MGQRRREPPELRRSTTSTRCTGLHRALRELRRHRRRRRARRRPVAATAWWSCPACTWSATRTPALDAAVAGGGHALVTFYSGIVDENDRVRPGGYPARLARPARHPGRGVRPGPAGRRAWRWNPGPRPRCGPSGCASRRRGRSTDSSADPPAACRRSPAARPRMPSATRGTSATLPDQAGLARIVDRRAQRGRRSARRPGARAARRRRAPRRTATAAIASSSTTAPTTCCSNARGRDLVTGERPRGPSAFPPGPSE